MKCLKLKFQKGMVEGNTIAKMNVNGCGRFIYAVLPPNSLIGSHKQETNDDINYNM